LVLLPWGLSRMTPPNAPETTLGGLAPLGGERDTASSFPLALESLQALHSQGFRAYFVGGCVRDRLLGIVPHDFDIATNARPADLLALFPDALEVGASFGVVIRRKKSAEVQIATFRREGGYADGRRPDAVDFVDEPREDAARRDFTINALFEDPVSGEVLDFFQGREDLAARCLRAVGDPHRRFQEDHLRMLRAVRFAARFGLNLDAATAAAIRENAPQIVRISAERIRDEISRILVEGAAARGFALLDELGLLDQILPEVKAMQGVEQPPQYHPEGDVWTHTMLMLEMLRQPPSLTQALGVLFHDIGKPGTQTITDRIRFNGHVEEGVRIARAIMNRLRYSGEETTQVCALVENHMKFMHLRDMRQSTRLRFLRMPLFDEHLELHRVDCLSSHRKLDNYDYAREELANLSAETLRPPPLLRGEDLMALGLKPGPQFRVILTNLEDEQLEGRLVDKEEALHWVRKHFSV